MNSAQALAVVRSLANGVDPESGEVFPPESPYQRPQVVRSLYEAATALERVERVERRRPVFLSALHSRALGGANNLPATPPPA